LLDAQDRKRTFQETIMLKRTLLLVLAALICAGLVGCKWGQKKTDEQEEAAQPMMMKPVENADTETAPWGSKTMENIERGE
jgi:hypothetical protein